jgi:hypothetical protein
VTIWRFDSDAIKWDADTITWDAGLLNGMVELELENGSKVLLLLANVRTEGFTYDRSMFRSPYGAVWHQEGDKRRLVENITVHAHIVDDAGGISDAAIDANALAVALPTVVRVESAISGWNVVGLLSYTRQAVESGYRFEIALVSD